MGLTPEQQAAFEKYKAGKNLFLTGKGGSGKSYLAQHIIKDASNVIVCASTGFAARSIGGITVHSAFRVPVGIVDPHKYYARPKKGARKDKWYDILSAAQLIIIDEISMCRADVFGWIARTIMHLPNRPQLIVVGDFYQLPPVLTDEDEEAYSACYGSQLYAFESVYWNQLGMETVELKTSMRQADSDFIAALDGIREGVDLPESLALLSTRKQASPDVHLSTLCSTNAKAEEINKRQLRDLGAKITAVRADILGDVKPEEYPTGYALELCAGAKVMMLCNDPEKRFVNGSVGTVKGIDEKYIAVCLDSGVEALIERKTWSFYTYAITKKDGKQHIEQVERGSFTQFPVKLAWAISIHKSQGQTFEGLNIDISKIFAQGQLYVALSRAKSLNGLRIIGDLTPEKVMVSDAVKLFMSGATASVPEPEAASVSTPEIKDDRYQEGYDDGYRDGTEITSAKYQDMVAADPGVKVLKERTKREKEKEGLPPEVRNPRGAGRKRSQPDALYETKPVRVPVEWAERIKELALLHKSAADRTAINERFYDLCNAFELMYSN